MPPQKRLHEENRLSWNAATEAHNSHKGDQAGYYREGGNQLHPEERDLLGDIHGLDVVHLQCNSGQDTLSLAQLGARVTGVDISDTAIEFARRLSEESGVPATFHRADVYDWLEETARSEQRFDVVYCSYGAICWLSDLTAWARGIAGVLRPGGRFITVDFHPVWLMMSYDWSRVEYPYFRFGEAGHLTDPNGIGDYVAVEMATTSDSPPPGVQDFHNPHPIHEFSWGIADIVGALLDAGLTLTALREYPYANSAHYPAMRTIAARRFLPPEDIPTIPLMYGIAARRDAPAGDTREGAAG
ncbi:MAG: class I SAM-dependent methyltransferase [Chloroflexota bacterium]|nr:class I SAM-dependent methyltransferase [Chloroflexota bacterium]